MPAPSTATAAWEVRPARSAAEAFYPSSDGERMAENTWQGQAILRAGGDLGVACPDALVAVDVLVYPEEGNPQNRIAPDVLVAFGVGRHHRSSYLAWEEGKPPDWVLEVASRSTVENDLNDKRCAYARIGVPEYWMFDPRGGLFPPGQPRLQGFKLVDGSYEPLAPLLADGLSMIHSETLRLHLRVDGDCIRFRCPVAGKDIRHQYEAEAELMQETARAEAAEARARAAETRAKAEAAGRKDAEARVARLEAALTRSR